MKSTCVTFLKGLIDYAGLFPPARLTLDATLENFLSYRAGSFAWMLGRLILPAPRIDELLAALAALAGPGPGPGIEGGPLPLALIVGVGTTENEALNTVGVELSSALDAIEAVGGESSPEVAIEVLETRFPLETVDTSDSSAALAYVQSLCGAVESLLSGRTWGPTTGRRRRGLELFLEIPASAAGYPLGATPLVAALAQMNKNLAAYPGPSSLKRLGFKLRSGGLEPQAFPSAQQTALLIATCQNLQVPMKCTAGLHHPIRHHDEASGVTMHGFFNVFGAGILAHALNIPEETIEACIEDQNPKSFSFSDRAFVWQDLQVTREQAATSRAEFMTSFGSCSFVEPLDDLMALGLIDRPAPGATGC